MGSVNLNSEQRNLILGTLLGDGTIEKRWRNPRLRIDHSIVQKDYVLWKYEVLKPLATRPPRISRQMDTRSRKEQLHSYFSTRAIPELNFYYELFYRSNRKIISKEIIKYFNHPLSLAVWIMDDGYKRNDCDALRLSTDCFSKEEQRLLQEVLAGNFGIRSAVHKKGNAWNIYIPQDQMNRVRFLTGSFVIPFMNYKLIPRNDLSSQHAGRIADHAAIIR